ncbi:MAG: 5,10-methylenetetrahydrofolate reductase, partial [Myxococcota bacterium]
PKEAERFRRKAEAGAHFTMTQPIYELDSLKRFMDLAKPEIPIMVGVLPLRNARHASFLHNEVPGMHIPDDVLARMQAAGEDGPKVGVEIAQEFLLKARDLVQGVYLMPPFNQFWMGVEVLKAI